jgi:hypothetical protein
MSTTFKMFLKHGRFRSDLKEEVWLVKPKLDLLRTYQVFSDFKNDQGWEWFWKRVEDFSDQSALVIRDRAHTSTLLPGTDFNTVFDIIQAKVMTLDCQDVRPADEELCVYLSAIMTWLLLPAIQVLFVVFSLSFLLSSKYITSKYYEYIKIEGSKSKFAQVQIGDEKIILPLVEVLETVLTKTSEVCGDGLRECEEEGLGFWFSWFARRQYPGTNAASLLLSLPGAPKQNHHHDFADWLPGGLFKQPRNADGTLPYALSVLIALEDGASWVVWKKGEKEKKKKIPRLGAVVFRGDLRHAGDAYHARNVRFHIYYGVKGEKGEVILAAPRDKEGAVSVVHAGT